MNYFWIIVACIEVLAVGLLLFGLLTACVARWRKKKLALTVLAVFALCVVGASVLAIATGYRLFTAGPHFNTMKYLLIVTVALSLIGYLAITRIGWRRHDPDALPEAATWPRSRLLLAFLVALSLSAVTHWNVKLSVQQRLAREEVEDRVTVLSVLPGRPIDSVNAAVLYEPVFERLPEHKVVQNDWLDFDKPLDTDDPVLRELLANHRRDLDALVRASTRPQCYFGIHQPRDILNIDVGWAGSMRFAARLLAVDTRVKIADGDLNGALQSTSALFGIAGHVDQTPILITGLISRGIYGWAIECVQALLNHRDLSAEMLSELQLDGRADYRRSLSRVLAIEEAAQTAIVKRISAEGFASWDVIGTPGQRDTLGTFLWTTTNAYYIEHELEHLRSIYRQLRALLEQPWPKASPQVEQLNVDKHSGGVLSQQIIPDWPLVTIGVIIGDARHRLCRLAIAIRRYELEHGDRPESFDDLVPSYIEEVPLDPTIEEPFKMEIVDGEVRLYSAEIESWDPEKYPGRAIKDTDSKVEMFLK